MKHCVICLVVLTGLVSGCANNPSRNYVAPDCQYFTPQNLTWESPLDGDDVEYTQSYNNKLIIRTSVKFIVMEGCYGRTLEDTLVMPCWPEERGNRYRIFMKSDFEGTSENDTTLEYLGKKYVLNERATFYWWEWIAKDYYENSDGGLLVLTGP